jgi:hypothetical protein
MRTSKEYFAENTTRTAVIKLIHLIVRPQTALYSYGPETFSKTAR